MLDSEVDMLLVRFTSLKHIVMDGCPVMRGDLHEREWRALGKRCALVGVKRAKEREAALKVWLESRTASTGSMTALRNESRKTKPGRKGLATASISLRDPDTDLGASSSPGGHSKPPTTHSTGKPKKKARIPSSKIRVLPLLPTLASLCVTLSPAIEPDRHPLICAEFHEGWAEGVAQLAATRARLRISAGNGYRIMRISTCGSDKEEKSDGESEDEGLEDLEDVDRLDPDTFGMPGLEEAHGSVYIATPVLCFAGPGKDGPHADNCGHSVGWEVMQDEL
ncbi:hypothetical protein GALMADRAFT_234494 [Galerina marginata CBS 339.88]|uniref:Uncharacterized protein n=1 Tax=Galerina marginata (strain CBS 339.88) TaxID=685588 RepID=A0A067TZX2_GALM3|nr:hypothetical protein GALMADRAFT_234494 [Galerina marginata CBS 339.88]